MLFTAVRRSLRVTVWTGGSLVLLLAAVGLAVIPVLGCGCDYTARAQVTEGMNLAAAPKAAISEFIRAERRAPANLAEAGFSLAANSIQGKYVSAVDIVDGRIDITYGNEAHPEIAGRMLSLTPYLNATDAGNEDIFWRCGLGDRPAAPAVAFAPYRPGTIPTRHLPGSCRPRRSP